MENLLFASLVLIAILLIVATQNRPRHPNYYHGKHAISQPHNMFYMHSRQSDLPSNSKWEEYQQNIRSLDFYAYIIAAFVLLYYLLQQ